MTSTFENCSTVAGPGVLIVERPRPGDIFEWCGEFRVYKIVSVYDSGYISEMYRLGYVRSALFRLGRMVKSAKRAIWRRLFIKNTVRGYDTGSKEKA